MPEWNCVKQYPQSRDCRRVRFALGCCRVVGIDTKTFSAECISPDQCSNITRDTNTLSCETARRSPCVIHDSLTPLPNFASIVFLRCKSSERIFEVSYGPSTCTDRTTPVVDREERSRSPERDGQQPRRSAFRLGRLRVGTRLLRVGEPYFFSVLSNGFRSAQRHR